MASTSIVLAHRYRLREPIGQGGMGRVWLATDELLGRDVAVKELVPPPGFSEAEVREMAARAVREARAAARLKHTNVIVVYDVIVEGDAPWIVMEYVKARSLYEVVADSGPLDVPAVARIGLAILSALRAAHRSGVLHRDVKPGNVLIADDRVVLTDFGLATILGDPAVTRTGVVIGSPSYMAPERARDGEAGPAADLWSLGATLYFAVEGQSPYDRGSAVATITALATEAPQTAMRAGALRPVLEGLLRRSPEDRLDPDTAERLLLIAATPQQARSDRTPAAALSPSTASAPSRPESPLSRPHRVRPVAVSVLAVLLVLVAITAWAAQAARTSHVDPPAASRSPASPSIGNPPASASLTRPPTPAPNAAASASAAALPPGWHRYADETGFSLAVPISWSVSRSGSIVYFREPQSGRYFGIDQTDQPQPDPVADWTGKEAYRVARGDFPGYQRIRIEEVQYFLKAADWEFTYLVDGTRVHVINRGFITSANQAYGLWWSTLDADWSGSLADLQRVQLSFVPGS